MLLLPARLKLCVLLILSTGMHPALARQAVTLDDGLATSLRSDPIKGGGTTDHLAQIALTTPSLTQVMNAEFLLSRGQPAQALQLYKQQAFKQDATAVFERALDLSLLYEQASTSLDFARTWQQQNPEHLPAQFYVAHLALKALDYDTASNIIQSILKEDPQADLSQILAGIYPVDTAGQQQLLTILQSLPEQSNSSLLVIKAGLLSRLGQPEAALVKITDALRQQPDVPAYITLKADILKQLKPYSEVIDYVRRQRERLGDKSLYLYDIRYRLARSERLPTAQKRQQTLDAWHLLMDANNRFDDDDITLLASLVSIDLQAYDTADALLSNLASSASHKDRAYYYLGISAERQERFAQAERFFSQVMQDDLVLDARRRLVSILLLQKRPDDALASLRLFAKQFPIYEPDYAVLQADILRQQGKTRAALNVIQRANTRFPDDLKLLFAYAQLLDNDADAVVKRQTLAHLLLLDPENITNQTAYAKFLFSQNRSEDIKKALKIANNVLAIDYDSPNFEQTNYLDALNITMADALTQQQYQVVVDTLKPVYDVTPYLDTGIILIRAYQGLGQDALVADLLQDLQSRFALGQTDIDDRLQAY